MRVAVVWYTTRTDILRILKYCFEKDFRRYIDRSNSYSKREVCIFDIKFTDTAKVDFVIDYHRSYKIIVAALRAKDIYGIRKTSYCY